MSVDRKVKWTKPEIFQTPITTVEAKNTRHSKGSGIKTKSLNKVIKSVPLSINKAKPNGLTVHTDEMATIIRLIRLTLPGILNIQTLTNQNRQTG